MSKDYIVHKAVEVSNTHKEVKALLSQPGYLEANYIAQPKYDGCNMVVVVQQHKDEKNNEWWWALDAYSRTGEIVKSVDHILMAMELLPGLKAGVYLGEAWAPDLTFPEISGRFRKQKTTEETARLQFVIFDYLTDIEWINETSLLGYEERVARLPSALAQIKQCAAPVWLAGSFGKLAETWPNTPAQKVCNELVAAGGYDGLILRDPDGRWFKGVPGHTGEIIKVKAKQSFDLRVVGYELGEGKHEGKIGTLVVEFRGKRQGAGTGLKDKDRFIYNFHQQWLGKIVEVECLGVTPDGLLREPRLKGVRHDKLEPDA